MCLPFDSSILNEMNLSNACIYKVHTCRIISIWWRIWEHFKTTVSTEREIAVVHIILKVRYGNVNCVKMCIFAFIIGYYNNKLFSSFFWKETKGKKSTVVAFGERDGGDWMRKNFTLYFALFWLQYLVIM